MQTIYQIKDKVNDKTIQIRGLSTDTKPIRFFNDTPILNGSEYYEMDTKSVSMYDEEHHVWIKQ